jgi:diacylglycerol kinase (ATP)
VKKLLINAPGRITRSFGYSWDAFKATFRKEESFRLECLAFAFLVVCLALSPWPLWKCLAMAGSFQLIPLAEIVNSAIEDICDGITRERVQFVKDAKDKGALAVLMAIIFNAFVLATLCTVD